MAETRHAAQPPSRAALRVLVVTNMYPGPDAPHRGAFVRDQVEALRRRTDVEIELYSFDPGFERYPLAARDLRRRYRGERFDVVHAHFGLTAWPALVARLGPVAVTMHGNDLYHPRSRPFTRAALPLVSLPAAVSRAFGDLVPGAGRTRRVAVLPCGIDMERFRPIPRPDARRRLGLDPDEPVLLFPHDPARPLKRFDRARALAGDVRLLTLGRVDPVEVPYWHNAANAVLVPSEAEGFGLAVIEASACDVPAFGTPVGIHPLALSGIEGSLCAPWDESTWRASLAPQLRASDPRVQGRARASLFSAERMAARMVAAWQAVAAEGGSVTVGQARARLGRRGRRGP
jgi:teichuronic acid biosynthesis glycosyltransferase TuaC